MDILLILGGYIIITLIKEGLTNSIGIETLTLQNYQEYVKSINDMQDYLMAKRSREKTKKDAFSKVLVPEKVDSVSDLSQKMQANTIDLSEFDSINTAQAPSSSGTTGGGGAADIKLLKEIMGLKVGAAYRTIQDYTKHALQSVTPSMITQQSVTPSIIPQQSATPSIIPQQSATQSLTPHQSVTQSIIPQQSVSPPVLGKQTSERNALPLPVQPNLNRQQIQSSSFSSVASISLSDSSPPRILNPSPSKKDFYANLPALTQTSESLAQMGVHPNMIRLSLGLFATDKEIFDFLFLLQEFPESFPSLLWDAYQKDSSSVTKVLQDISALKEMGFSSAQVGQALVYSKLDKDAALEKLLSNM